MFPAQQLSALTPQQIQAMQAMMTNMMGGQNNAFMAPQNQMFLNQNNTNNLKTNSNQLMAETSPEPPIEQPPKRKERLKVKLKIEEKGTYSSIFTCADKKDTGRITPEDVKTFLKRSGINISKIDSIMNLLTSQPNFINFDRDDFYVAIRLVAHAQNGKEISEDLIFKNVEAPIPKFNLSNTTQLKYEIVPPSKDELSKYDRIFESIDTDNYGVISTEQMQNLLVNSRLDENTLSSIWDLVDFEDKGRFDKQMVRLALYLVSKKKSGEDLPKELSQDSRRLFSIADTPSKKLFDQPIHVKNEVQKKNEEDEFDIYNQINKTQNQAKPQNKIESNINSSNTKNKKVEEMRFKMKDNFMENLQFLYKYKRDEVQKLKGVIEDEEHNLVVMKEANSSLGSNLFRMKKEFEQLTNMLSKLKNVDISTLDFSNDEIIKSNVTNINEKKVEAQNKFPKVESSKSDDPLISTVEDNDFFLPAKPQKQIKNEEKKIQVSKQNPNEKPIKKEEKKKAPKEDDIWFDAESSINKSPEINKNNSKGSSKANMFGNSNMYEQKNDDEDTFAFN